MDDNEKERFDRIVSDVADKETKMKNGVKALFWFVATIMLMLFGFVGLIMWIITFFVNL